MQKNRKNDKRYLVLYQLMNNKDLKKRMCYVMIILKKKTKSLYDVIYKKQKN